MKKERIIFLAAIFLVNTQSFSSECEKLAVYRQDNEVNKELYSTYPEKDTDKDKAMGYKLRKKNDEQKDCIPLGECASFCCDEYFKMIWATWSLYLSKH